jgi:hypothetical protein
VKARVSSLAEINCLLRCPFRREDRTSRDRCGTTAKGHSFWSLARSLPVRPTKRTFPESVGMSQRCQTRKPPHVVRQARGVSVERDHCFLQDDRTEGIDTFGLVVPSNT